MLATSWRCCVRTSAGTGPPKVACQPRLHLLAWCIGWALCGCDSSSSSFSNNNSSGRQSRLLHQPTCSCKKSNETSTTLKRLHSTRHFVHVHSSNCNAVHCRASFAGVAATAARARNIPQHGLHTGKLRVAEIEKRTQRVEGSTPLRPVHTQEVVDNTSHCRHG